MGKKRTRSTYVSKGQRQNVSASTLKLCRSGRSEIDKILNKVKAWKLGKNPWVSFGEGKTAGRARANSFWGDPKGRRDEREEKFL